MGQTCNSCLNSDSNLETQAEKRERIEEQENQSKFQKWFYTTQREPTNYYDIILCLTPKSHFDYYF